MTEDGSLHPGELGQLGKQWKGGQVGGRERPDDELGFGLSEAEASEISQHSCDVRTCLQLGSVAGIGYTDWRINTQMGHQGN